MFKNTSPSTTYKRYDFMVGPFRVIAGTAPWTERREVVLNRHFRMFSVMGFHKVFTVIGPKDWTR